jgi:hypothetical protein
MKITTPTATLGIRGTTGLVEVPEGATAGSNNVAIKLYPDADGRVGRIEVNDRTGVRLGALTQGASGFTIRPGMGGGARFAAVPLAISPREAVRDQGFVRQVHDAQTVGRRIVTEQRAFRRANPNLNRGNRPGANTPNRGNQPGQQRQNGLPGQNQPGQNRPGQNQKGQPQPGAPNRQGTQQPPRGPQQPGQPQRPGQNPQPGQPGQPQRSGQNPRSGQPTEPQRSGQSPQPGQPGQPQRPGQGPQHERPGTPPQPAVQPRQGGLRPGAPSVQRPQLPNRPAFRRPSPPSRGKKKEPR